MGFPLALFREAVKGKVEIVVIGIWSVDSSGGWSNEVIASVWECETWLLFVRGDGGVKLTTIVLLHASLLAKILGFPDSLL